MSRDRFAALNIMTSPFVTPKNLFDEKQADFPIALILKGNCKGNKFDDRHIFFNRSIFGWTLQFLAIELKCRFFDYNMFW